MTRIRRLARALAPAHRVGRTVGLSAGVILAVAISGCSNGDPVPAESPSEKQRTESDEPGDGAQVEITESAFTVTEDSSGDPMVSYAIILSNPGTDIALYTKLEIQLLDADGEAIVDLDADRESVNRDAFLIMPGQTQAVSALTYVESGDVESIDVALSGTEWADPEDDRFMPLTADDVSAEADGNRAVVTFAVDSPYDNELTAVSTYAIFRDSSGELLGGSAAIDADPLSYVPGINDGEIEVSGGVPPEWDPDSTEVYVDPFVG